MAQIEEDEEDDNSASTAKETDQLRRRSQKNTVQSTNGGIDADKVGSTQPPHKLPGLVASGAQTITQRLLEKTRERQAKNKIYRKAYDLKLAFSEFYLSLILLQNYQNLNVTGFKKILKKHDKV